MSGPMDMIFGVFSETDARLLKKYNLCFWSLAKTQAMLSLSNYNRTLQELFRMALIKSLAFVVFEILSNLVSMQNFLNANNC